MKKIGVVDSDNMGRVVGLNWAEKGHRISLGLVNLPQPSRSKFGGRQTGSL